MSHLRSGPAGGFPLPRAAPPRGKACLHPPGGSLFLPLEAPFSSTSAPKPPSDLPTPLKTRTGSARRARHGHCRIDR
eukprot:2388102-Pyramimonas_sp.AAC.1